ncbi:class I SAM-dependent methyltransferase [Kurthia sibirica]|uniref:Class I SAM-dependent methyltransferase n=1 Tax=Kurthia sibirica TaxID=202750 RepID=A0A2U3AP38_9BACL|nr:class I SAM-dependent methyltransferase [Kurthia sibirica]PWI26215.1 class I SAM-dependent methyltransferase [Kurthia sibirica]GEK34729.1 adenine-specific DNA methyltransferase [Kurthia sibirica]
MENIEQIYTFIDTEAEKVSKELDVTYLDGVRSALSTLLNTDEHEAIMGVTKEDIRKATQLAILKGMRKNVQPNHQMTPDSLGFLVGYFVDQFFSKELKKEGKLTILDPAVGTGNLMLTVMNHMDGKLEGLGVEIDDLLIQLAAVSADLQEQPVALFRQDVLQNLIIDPVDGVVCDLPIGYYPDEENAAKFEIHVEEGMTYAHHMIIEQSMNYTKDGGYLFFLVPNNIFESEQAQLLYKYVQTHAWIQAVIQLPENLFKKQEMAKSLFILQKKYDGGKAVKDVLLAKVPKLDNIQALESFFAQVQIWKLEEKK